MMMPLRSLRQTPGLSITIVLLLGFGIGANTALFSLCRALLLRPIPGVRDSGELVRVRRTQYGHSQGNQSYPDYIAFRDRSKTIVGLAAERLVSLRLAGPAAQIVQGAAVTGNYFQVLGATAAAGRLLGTDDDRIPGGHPVVVVSEAFWRRQFAGNPQAVGAAINLNGYPFTIVGVVAAPFEGVDSGERTAIWMPVMMVKQAMPRSSGYPFLQDRGAGWLTWYGRLRAGVTPAGVEREWNAIAARLEAQYPTTNHGRRWEVDDHASMDRERRGSMSRLVGLLFAAVCLVLLIACGNVANLLLARGAGRAREMAIRLALGAGRAVLIRQLLAESLLLALAGGTLGLTLAPWMTSVLSKVWNQSLAFVVDGQVLGFALAASLLCVLVCGLAPAWAASSTNVATVLKDGTPGSGRGRLQRTFVVAQLALSVALVAAGALVLGSMRRIVSIQPGFEKNVVMISMDLSLLGYSADRATQFFTDLARHAAAMPGVHSVSLGKSSPAVDLSDRVNVYRTGEIPAEGFAEEQAANAIRADRNTVAPSYFATLGIPLIAGRDFTAADRAGSALVAIVSQALAKRLWRGGNAIGRQLLMAADARTAPMPLEVIGVAADAHYRSVLDEPPPVLYIPLLQNYDSVSRLMVAVNGAAADFKEPLRRAVQQFHPDLPVRPTSTVQEQIDQSLWQRRAAADVLALFGLLALVLTCTGIHGVVAHSTARRAREIGIRMALGAKRGDVLREIAGRAVRMALAGIAIGIGLAAWAKPAVANYLYGAEDVNAITFGAVAVLFVAIALLAAALPARRAASIDPALALRME
jgi:predicted permease